MFKRSKVVMLATNQKSKIILSARRLMLCPYLDTVWNDTTGKCQHLYILSDDEVKEGDWVYNSANKDYYIMTKGLLSNPWTKRDCKKIIATTDESLGLPRPSNSFIEVYIKEYNKSNQITDIMVEYEQVDTLHSDPFERLKVSSDNTITIRKIKDTWTREEVEKLCENAYDSGRYATIDKDIDQTFDNWKQRNL